MPPRRLAVRASSLLLTVPLALVVTGCDAPATLDPADAAATYADVQEDLVAALGGPAGWDTTGEASLSGEDGSCTLVLPRATTQQYLAADDGSTDDVASALDPVLAEHGFSELGDGESVEGGAVVADASDDDGAEVVVASEQTSSLSVTVPVDPAACDGEGSFPVPTS
ncbi:hypothetical protein IF650_02275 [Cellulosimicrobium terreum]|nr:hypothetical protein [Cellulosimicrobium terreum]